jgi:hypothetical protein
MIDAIILLIYGLHLVLPLTLGTAWYIKYNLEQIRKEKKIMGTIYRMTRRR